MIHFQNQNDNPPSDSSGASAKHLRHSPTVPDEDDSVLHKSSVLVRCTYAADCFWRACLRSPFWEYFVVAVQAFLWLFFVWVLLDIPCAICITYLSISFLWSLPLVIEFGFKGCEWYEIVRWDMMEWRMNTTEKENNQDQITLACMRVISCNVV